MLGKVEGSQAKRGAPVHLSKPVTGGELPDLAGFDAFAERRRHVVTDRRLRVKGTWQAPKRNESRIHAHDLAIDVAPLPCPDAPPIARPEHDRPEGVRAAEAAHVVTEAGRPARPQSHQRAVV